MSKPLQRAIREARVAARLTQVQVGQRLGLKGRAVYRWERGDSLPKRRYWRALVTAIGMTDPAAAARLEAALLAHLQAAKGVVVQPATPPPPPPKPEALELAVFAMADELDLPPRRLRAALVRLFARTAQAHYTVDAAQRELESRIAAQSES